MIFTHPHLSIGMDGEVSVERRTFKVTKSQLNTQLKCENKSNKRGRLENSSPLMIERQRNIQNRNLEDC